jgi:hypothetical protein
MAIQLKILIIIVLLAGCTIPVEVKKPEKATHDIEYSTQNIREMWQMCSIQYQAAGVSQVEYYYLCDCAVDYMKRNIEQKKISTLTPSQSTALGLVLQKECPKQEIKPVNFTNGDIWETKTLKNRSI